MAKTKLPKKLYAKVEKDGNDRWVTSYETLDSLEHGDVIGIYELVDTKTIKITQELE